MPTTQPTLFSKPRRARRGYPAGAGKLKAGERSLRYLRALGYRAEVCEKFIAKVEGKGQQQRFSGGYRKDLFGFVDILAFRDSCSHFGPEYQPTLAVQTTSRQQIAPHLRKFRGDPEIARLIREWLAIPGRGLVIHGWEAVEVRNKSRPGTRVEWRVTERWVSAEDLA